MTIYIVELREGHVRGGRVAEDIDLQKLTSEELAFLLISSKFCSEDFLKTLSHLRISGNNFRVDSPLDIELSKLEHGDHILTFQMGEQANGEDAPISAEWVAGYRYRGYPESPGNQ